MWGMDRGKDFRMLDELATTRTQRAALGRATLAELRRHLWPGDCQTCGQTFGETRPALVVDDMGVTARASLHHQHCQAPIWNDSGIVVHDTSAATLTYVSGAFLAPLHLDEHGNGQYARRDVPAMLVNPGLEAVNLRRAGRRRWPQGRRRWQVGSLDEYTAVGLGPFSAMGIGEHTAAVTGQLVGTDLVVQCLGGVWSAPTIDTVLAQLHAYDGLILIVTSALNPHDHAAFSQIPQLLAAGRALVCWVGLDADQATPPDYLRQLVTGPYTPLPVSAHDPDNSADTETPPVGPVGWPGPSYDPATGTFVVARTAEHDQMRWQLHEPGVALRHGLINGPQGSGKTNVLTMLLAEALDSDRFQVMLADPLDRNGLCDQVADIAHVRTARTYRDTLDLLEDACAAIDRRRQGDQPTPSPDPTPDDPGLLLIIDDAEPVLTTQHAARLARHITTHGGPAHVALVVSTRSVEPRNFGGDTALIADLARGNCLSSDPANLEFLRSLLADDRN